MKKQNLAQLLKLLKQDNLFYELHNRNDADIAGVDTSDYMIIRNLDNLYKSEKILYINMNIDSDLNIYDLMLVINYKDENHSFIELSNINEIIHLAYDYFK